MLNYSEHQLETYIQRLCRKLANHGIERTPQEIRDKIRSCIAEGPAPLTNYVRLFKAASFLCEDDSAFQKLLNEMEHLE